MNGRDEALFKTLVFSRGTHGLRTHGLRPELALLGKHLCGQLYPKKGILGP